MKSYDRLEGKVAIITGAARGIGKAIALGYAREGANVVIADILEEEMEETKKEIEAIGQRALAINCDISKYENCENVARQTVDSFGKIDILINVAANLTTLDFLDTPPEVFARMSDINLDGTFYMCRAVLPTMLEQGKGNIINCITGYVRLMPPLAPAYSATKAGAVMLTRCIAGEFSKKGIRSNAFYPGPTPTNAVKQIKEEQEVWDALAKSIPMGRVGKPDDYVGIAVFLGCDESEFITGQMIACDGGHTMC